MTARRNRLADKKPRRPNVTDDEKAKLLAVCHEIRAEEPELPVRAYMYRIWGRGDVYLHGDLCLKEATAADVGADRNEETIQRMLLQFRRDGLIPYESIIDDTRPTSGGDFGWDDIDEARESIANHREYVIDGYTLSIWKPQRKYVEILSEKLTLAPIVERPANELGVAVTSIRGFSSESALYAVAERAVRIGRPTTILILTDNDRAGLNMTDHVTRDIRRLVRLVCRARRWRRPLPITFRRIGLNDEQVARYGAGDRRRRPKASEHAGMKNFVANPCEVEALRSAQIEEIVREGIEAELDMDILRATREQEAADIETLRSED